jgi:hypothetical protein
MLYITSAKGNTAGEAAVRARGASRNTRETDGEGKNTNRLKNTKQACTGIAQLRAVAEITKNIPGQTLRLLSQAGVQSHVYQARTITTTRSTSYGAPAAAPHVVRVCAVCRVLRLDAPPRMIVRYRHLLATTLNSIP